MKKTFLNLRKMGFVLVAASAMLAFSCGGEAADDAAETATEAVEEATEATEEAVEEATEAVEEAACEEGACEEGACDGGDAAEDHSCDHGE
jgi:basic membrane protein A